MHTIFLAIFQQQKRCTIFTRRAISQPDKNHSKTFFNTRSLFDDMLLKTINSQCNTAFIIQVHFIVFDDWIWQNVVIIAIDSHPTKFLLWAFNALCCRLFYFSNFDLAQSIWLRFFIPLRMRNSE